MENQGQELVEAKGYLEKQVALAEALQRLQHNPDWKLLIEDVYVRDWALTQINNLAVYNQDQRRGYLEQAMARSVFNQFIYEISEGGKMAKEGLAEIKQELEG
jgi:hypothetical protein